MTKVQAKKFRTLCKKLSDLHAEIRKEHPNAQIFIEDGNIDIYDWPVDEARPEHPMARGAYVHESGGGGR